MIQVSYRLPLVLELKQQITWPNGDFQFGELGGGR